MTKVIHCTECNTSGGDVPKYYWDGVVEMMHRDCAVKNIERYMAKKDLELEGERA